MTQKRISSDPDKDMMLLAQLRKYLIANGGRVKPRRMTRARAEMQKKLDEALLAFRMARRATAAAGIGGEGWGWLRMVRQATGLPVAVLERRLKVTKNEIFRLEKAERSGRIMLGSLKRAAEGMGCDLVYALTPREGSLADLAAAERAEQEKARAKIRELEEQRVAKIENRLGWREAMGKMARHHLRKLGIRVR